jgi:allantoinase
LEKQKKLLFRGGTIVLPDRAIQASLLVENGKIIGILDKDVSGDYEIVNVSGKVLLPGVIDTHVHMWDPSPFDYREDWNYGSQCAASGGITTIIDMPLSVPPVVDKSGFDLKMDVAKENSCVDFAFWGGLTPDSIENMEELDRLGCVAYKGFMSFANPDYPQITDGYLIEGMKIAKKIDGLIGVHAENAEVADFGSRFMAEIGETDQSKHDDARPWWVELEAIQRAVLFSKVTEARLYIVHMTIAEGAEYLKRAKHEGVDVTVETCPQYLLFDKTILREKGAYAKCNPPLRSRDNVEKMWKYIFDGTIDTIGSDHGPYADEEKVKEGNFFKEYSGFGGYDAMLPVLISEGVNKRGLSLPKLASLTSGNAAKAMGLFPKKGSLGIGADIVVVDLNEEWVFNGKESLSKTKSINNIYHGIKLKGRVKQTWVRGQLVYDGEKVVAPAGYGEFVPKGKE